MTDKAISEVFDIEPIQRQELHVPKPEGDEIAHDAEYAADNIRKLITIGMNSVEDAALVARDSEQPRAYEVVQTMIKHLTDMNLQLMDIHSKKKDLNNGTQQMSNPQNVTTNNAFFVGTTRDLNEIIMKRLAENGN